MVISGGIGVVAIKTKLHIGLTMEKYYRTKKTSKTFTEDLEFQALEWQEFNVSENHDEDNMSDDMDVDPGYGSTVSKQNEKYVIKIFGVNKLGDSVCLKVNNFTPFFFIKVPDTWGATDVSACIQILKRTLANAKRKVDDSWFTFDFSGCFVDELCKIQVKCDFYGFTNEKKGKFLRLVFTNSEAMKKCISVIKGNNIGTKKVSGLEKLPLYESNIDAMIKFAHIRDLKFAGWIHVPRKFIEDNKVSSDEYFSNCQREYEVDWKCVKGMNENSNAPILQASYDIETYSIDGKFPVPEIKGNVITQIATTFKYFGSQNVYMKHIICLKKCSPLQPSDDGVPVFLECYDRETDLLMAWKRLIVNTDPDILYQYNGDQFDGNYIYTRTGINGIREEFLEGIGKTVYSPGSLVENKFSSSAYGSSNFKRLCMPGRINFDILIYIKREYKENSYKLDYIAEKYVGQNKNPMTAQMMFEIFKEGNPDRIATVCEYCLVDTLLPQKLVDKLHILQNQISMSNVSHVPIRYLIERGQQIKVFSQILRETRKQNFLVPALELAAFENANKIKDSEDSDDEEDSFTGATVLPPLKGAYFEPVTVCDFASLYPSIIRAHNLCFSTIVLDKKFGGIPGIQYETFEWIDNENDETKKEINHSYTFCQSKQGVLPKLLADLSIARKDYKKLMNTTEDPFLAEVYNKCQMAVKVSMNSIYGFLAAPMLKCKPIAATVTAIGRKMIENTKKYMEENYKASVAVYGDSVTGRTPLLLRDPDSGEIHIKTIQSLMEEQEIIDYPGFKAYDSVSIRQDKVYSLTKYEAWTDKGWSPIKKVIRHKTHKKIYKILTHTGMVEVTEDHSLLDENCEIIKPGYCDTSTKLLSSYPSSMPDINYGISKNKAILYGFFYGDGSCGRYVCKSSGVKYSWALNNSDIEVLRYLKKLLEAEYPDTVFTIDDTMESSGVYKLRGQKHKKFVEEYIEKFYNEEERVKKVPTEILNSNNEIIQAFFEGYFMADGCRKDKEKIGCTRFDNKGQIGSSGLYFLMKKMGYNVSLNSRQDKENMLRITITKKNQRKTPNQIKKISCEDLGEIYVYDLETELGRFNAGVGDIVVKNTDSVFIKFSSDKTKKYKELFEKSHANPDCQETSRELAKLKAECIRESMALGKEASKKATKALFKEPIDLEYEKVYFPLLLLSKKRYIGELYSENPEKPDKVDNKGVVLKRRDNFELLKKLYSGVLGILMKKGNYGLNEAREYIEEILFKIVNNEFKDLDDFVISKLLKDTYKSKNIPHLVLARKMTIRDPGSAPSSNDRVPYVFTYPDQSTQYGKELLEYIKKERESEFMDKVSERHGKKIKTLEEAIVINKKLPKKAVLKKMNGKFSQYEKVEDPGYMIKHGLPLDAEYYITFMKTSVCEILALFMENPEKIFDDVISEFKNSRW
jgi:DNA polymerase elongation subunit (family B)